MAYRVFLDTNVLYGNLSTDVFLSVASNRAAALSVFWSDYVMHELETHLTERFEHLYRNEDKHMAFQRTNKRIRAMNEQFPNASIPASRWKPFLPQVRGFVSDPDDAPILAAAKAVNANYLATNNIADFDSEGIDKVLSIRTLRPGDVMNVIYSADQRTVENVLNRMLRKHHAPPRNIDELRKRLAKTPGWESFLPTLDAWAERTVHSDRRVIGDGGYQPRDSRGRFMRKIGGVDDDLADADLPEEY